jgi:hypothetical protein
MTIANNRTLRLRPVVPTATVPKQALQREDPAEQKHQTAAIEIA